MKLEEVEQKIKRVKEVFKGVDFDPYVVNVWGWVTELQGILTTEVKDQIEKAGFKLVGSFTGKDGVEYYYWRKGDIKITLHTR